MKYINIKSFKLGLTLLILSSVFALNGCASLKLKQAVADANDPAVVKEYENKINTIAKEITSDPDYKRIPLDTKEDIDWFVTQSFLYWDGKSSKQEFIDIGLKRFPGYRDSFEYLAKRLKK